MKHRDIIKQTDLTGNDIHISRKTFIRLTIKGAATFVLAPAIMQKDKINPPIKAVAFDAYALFDTSTIFSVVEKEFPGKSVEFMNTWRNRQFEYTWLRSLSRKYKDFWEITEDALTYTAYFLKLEMTPEAKTSLMRAVLDMKFRAEAGAALHRLKDMSLQLAILSNATPKMLHAGISNSGLQNIFDFVISTDSIKTYKPDPAAYQLGVKALKLKKSEIMFVASGGWDEAGAKSFGYPTVWINPAELPVEQLNATPDLICKNLTELADYIKKRLT